MRSTIYLVFFCLIFVACDSSNSSTDDTPAATVPTLQTTEVTSVTHNSANSGGNMLNDNGSSITAKGVCWSIDPIVPTIDDAHTTDAAGTPPYMSTISGLEPNTHYLVRAYAINELGIGYGEKLEFTTTNAPGTPSCTPAANSITFNSVLQNYDTTAGTMNLLYGQYGLIGTNSESNLHIEFKEPPLTGVFSSVEAGTTIFANNCVISGTFGDGFGEEYVAAADEQVYVVRNGENQYSVTFCGVVLNSTDSAMRFTTDANLTSL